MTLGDNRSACATPVPESSYKVFTSIYNWLPTRYVIVLIAATANAVEYTLRANLSITIVAMSPTTPGITGINGTITNSTSAAIKGDFEWSQTVQGVILGSFYYGYIFTHLVGGQLAQLVGGKRLILASLTVSTLLTLLTPAAAYWDVSALIALRVITGIAQGIMTPAVYTMLSCWTPERERSMALAFIVVGGNVGALGVMPLSGYLVGHLSWHVLGGIGAVCCVLWLILVYDTPSQHPRITESELKFILENLESKDAMATAKVPWGKILTSGTVWATALAKFSGSWGYYMLLTKLPSYLNDVHGLAIDANGNVNALVYVAMSVALMVSGYLSDLCEARRILSKSLSRKLFEIIALIGPAIAMALIPQFGPADAQVIISLLVVAMTLYGFYGGGDNPIVVDMAPDFSGSVYGLACAISSIPGFVAPLFVGFILDIDPSNAVLMWDYVFWSSTLVYVIGAGTFVLFARADPQPWGRYQEESNTEGFTVQPMKE